MTPIHKPAAVAALIAATLVGTGGATAGDDTDGYTWSNSAPTDVPGDDGDTDGYTWSD